MWEIEIIKKKELKLKNILLKNAFPLFGFGALVWFLFRVVPKPSRAAYPCMKVAAPMVSSFVLWIIGLTAAIFSFKKMKITFMKFSYLQAGLSLLVGTLFLIIGFSNDGILSFAKTNNFNEEVTPLTPIGEAKGINPGRVVWFGILTQQMKIVPTNIMEQKKFRLILVMMVGS